MKNESLEQLESIINKFIEKYNEQKKISEQRVDCIGINTNNSVTKNKEKIVTDIKTCINQIDKCLKYIENQ